MGINHTFMDITKLTKAELLKKCQDKGINNVKSKTKKVLIELLGNIDDESLHESTKQSLGQFYTTNHDYILQGMKIPDFVKDIVEPFAGNGDLLSFIEKEQLTSDVEYTIECYDIEPKREFVVMQDTIQNPPDYNNKYIITNPPYLARNKSKDKTLFDKYDVNDLYKCVIKNILTNHCLGGIFIVPLNFWSSIRNADIELRKLFLERYDVILLNIFEEQVFDDTTYTICSFQFELKNGSNNTNQINIIVYPSKTNISVELNRDNNFMIGGDIYNLPLKNVYKISRLTTKNIERKRISFDLVYSITEYILDNFDDRNLIL